VERVAVGFRFSSLKLFGGMVMIALMLGTLQSVPRDAPARTVAMSGLDLGVLIFALMCGLMGHCLARTLVLSGTLFAWGYATLFVVDWLHLSSEWRCVVAALGVGYALWGALFSPRWSTFSFPSPSPLPRREELNI
jgi:hypothetical protein